jgi:hypothetical protein
MLPTVKAQRGAGEGGQGGTEAGSGYAAPSRVSPQGGAIA